MLHNNKQFLEDLLIERAVRAIIQVLYDKGSIDIYNKGNAHEMLKDFLPIEDNKRRRPNLE